jgi:integrase
VWLLERLAAVLERRGLTAADGDTLLFVAGGGEPLNYTNWRRRTWLPACEKAKLPHLRFHDLRSLAATALVAAGVDVKTAQTRLGHSSPQVTLALYARTTVAADRKAADAVGDAFRPRDGRAMKQSRLGGPPAKTGA